MRFPGRTRKVVLGILLMAGTLPVLAAGSNDPRALPGGTFKTVVPFEVGTDSVIVPAFRLDVVPISNAQFLEFTRAHPAWRRSRAPRLFAGEGYLSHWESDTSLGSGALPQQPVTRVSWFAAMDYCNAKGGRLPRWHEWEFAAAADDTRKDARDDPAWRQSMLNWYTTGSGGALPNIPHGVANAWGIRDLNGVIWEWAEDYNALLIGSDDREQGSGDAFKFCGAGAIMEKKENYAVLMRVAMLSSLNANQLTRDLGFRCAYDVPLEP